MTIPQFKIGDLIYLKSSAQIGFLESYRITEVFQVMKDRWLYKIAIEKNPPTSQTVGDRIDLKTYADLIFDESELLTYCEAQELVVISLERRLTVERARLTARCQSGSGGSVGS
jgi:hypothetical protein